jgi:hypothetical protein
MLASIIA